MAKELKSEVIAIPCTPTFKKKYVGICEEKEESLAVFGMAAIKDKIKKEGFGDKYDIT